MNRHLHSPTKLTEFARDFEEEPETFFSKFVNKITNAYNTSYNTVNELANVSNNTSGNTLLSINLLNNQNDNLNVNDNNNSNSSSSSSNSINNSNDNNKKNNDENNQQQQQQSQISRTNSCSSVNSQSSKQQKTEQCGNNGNRVASEQFLKVSIVNLATGTTAAADKSTSDSLGSTSEDTSESIEKCEVLSIENNEGRTMVNVLKRISNIVAAKNNNLRNYKDTELHRYWMPDSTAKECYDCRQKFSAFRRKHHCRLCGQIFCSKCCNQVVPGKIIMCSGNLKVCTYCSKIVLSYLKSSDITLDLKADLQALQDDLSNKFSQNPEQDIQVTHEQHNMIYSSVTPRKISVGYQEERLVSNQPPANFSTIDRRNILQQSNSLKALHEEMIQLLPLQNCGSELISFLIKNQKSSNKIQAIAILNAMLEAGFLNPIVHDSDQTEFDECLHYKLVRKNDILRQSGNIQLDVDYESSSVHMSRSVQDDMSVVCENDFQTFKSIEESVSFQSVKEIEMEDSMRSTTTTAKQLVKAYCDHEEILLSQMLRNFNLDQSWSKTLITLCARAANQFRPEFCTNDLMDIRNYVNFKKVPGGSRNDCLIIGGVVFSKNVAHKEMAKKVERPKILLLQCPIVYERVEGKFVSIETLILQEKEYLKNVTTRILSLKPNVVLVHKNVAGIAQEMLRSHGITLVLDVKVSVMERLARCLQCDIVTSIESNIGKPKLGLCDMFYIKNFDDGNGSSKTLMFFEMLSSPRGCCCLLRGTNNNNELANVKKVASMLLYARYNWRLEMSFLLDEFARPPSPKPLIFESKEHSPSSDNDYNRTKTVEKFENKTTINQIDKNDIDHSSSTSTSSTGNINKKLIERKSEEKLIMIEDVKDFSDPLRAPELPITKLDSDNVIVELAVQTPYDNRFRTALSSTVLSISPFVSFPLPYLETEQGRKCPLRLLFPNELYFSKQWSNTTITTTSTNNNNNNNGNNNNTLEKSSTHIENDNNNANIKEKINLKPPHDFVKHKITKPIDDIKLQTLLAEFRANGGRYPKTNKMVKVIKKYEYQHPQKATENFLYKDALNLENHQRLPVLFCSFYYNPKAASSFCAQPTLLEMKFYGQHDIMLGQFLQRYCFRSSYICQSCNLPMMDHVRRYVHSMGCVQVFLSEENTKNDSDKIYLTSRCSYCNEMTPNIPLSPDTCCLSFAKYLELRFHGHVYKKRIIDYTENVLTANNGNELKNDNDQNKDQQQNLQKCNHSLHRDYIHYFSYRGIGAKFIYTPIEVWEINIPQLIMHLNKPKPFNMKQVLEDIKHFSVKGHEVYSKIYERIAELATEDETPMLSSLKLILNRDQFLFRQHVEIVQTLLTEKLVNSYDINDAMIMAKRALADSIELWGPRLHEAAKTIQKQESSSHIDSGTICTEDLITDNSELSVERKQQQQTPMSITTTTTTNTTTTTSTATTTTTTTTTITTSNTTIDSMNISGTASGINTTNNSSVTNTTYTLDESSKRQDPQTSSTSLLDENSSSKMKEVTLKSNHQEQHIVSDKKSIKQLLSQLLPSTGQVNSLQSPLSTNEHLTLPLGAFPVLVHDQDLSSFIAYSLVSNEYKKSVENLNSSSANVTNENSTNNNSPSIKQKSNDGLIDSNDEKDSNITNTKNEEDKKSKTNHHIELYFQSSSVQFTCKIYFAKEFDIMRASVLKPPKLEKSLYKTLELSKKREEIRLIQKNTVANTNTSGKSNVGGGEIVMSASSGVSMVRDLSALSSSSSSSSLPSVSSSQQQQQQQHQHQQQQQLNQQQFDIDETRTALARSLCRSIQWEARGGKSGSKFSKTLDDRFILKEMTKNDVTKFEEDIAQNYFEYIKKCLQQNQPTLLVKILGIFRVSVKKKDSITEKSLLVMENLFYGCDIKNKFDLKGSERNRLVVPTNQNGEIVLLDENLIQMSWSNPLYVLSHSKTILREAINRDTSFLERNDVMDYSLLVGLDNKDKVLVLGIIDYIRTYTIDKRIESIVKQSGLLGGQGKLPTVISPARYKQRFIEAMDRYFYSVPDRWEGLSKK